MDRKVKQLIPTDSSDGFLKNISELIEEYRNDNIECFCLVYKRKEGGGLRTCFINRDDPNMLSVLIRLMLDMANEYSAAAISVKEY